MSTVLDVIGLKKYFPVRRGLWQRRVGTVRAVDDVTFKVVRGETLGVVGESGSGKTTVARTVVRLTAPTAGHVVFDGHNLDCLNSKELRQIRPRMQMIFQDPYSSLNPRMNVRSLIGEPLVEHTRMKKAERRARTAELMSVVGLDPAFEDRYPHEFSGGQQQRIGIARALALNPGLVVCDEPISALDVSIQAQIMNLFEDVQDRFGLTYLFISHDLGMIRHMCDRVAVMYLGRIAEMGLEEDVYRRPGPIPISVASANGLFSPVRSPARPSHHRGVPSIRGVRSSSLVAKSTGPSFARWLRSIMRLATSSIQRPSNRSETAKRTRKDFVVGDDVCVMTSSSLDNVEFEASSYAAAHSRTPCTSRSRSDKRVKTFGAMRAPCSTPTVKMR